MKNENKDLIDNYSLLLIMKNTEVSKIMLRKRRDKVVKR